MTCTTLERSFRRLYDVNKELIVDAKQSETFCLELSEVLGRLAAPASEQVSYLTKLGVLPLVDELALELDDLIGLVPQLVEHGRVTQEQTKAIYAVDHKLPEMSKRKDLWTELALREQPEWEEVRRLASISVREIGGLL